MKARDLVRAQHYAASTGHELATQAAMAVLGEGGNAVDAGVAAGMALGVLHSDLVNFAGVAPIMIRMAATGETVTIDGLGVWPRLARLEYFEREHGGAIPEGIQRTVVPAAPAAWILALRRYGTMTFKDVAQYACRYASEGFPVYPLFAQFIADNESAYRRTPATAAIYLPAGSPPVVGQTFVQADLGRTIQTMIDASEAASGGRDAGLRAAHDAFYRGDIAATISDYHQRHGGFLRFDDMAAFEPKVQAPLHVAYKDVEVLTCGPWCQGVSLAQAFRMLDAIDVVASGHNTPEYVHTLSSVFDLVFADRDAFVADPSFVDVPVRQMLDTQYLAARRALIQPDTAFAEPPPPGDPYTGSATGSFTQPAAPIGEGAGTHIQNDPASADTSYVSVIDADGNVFSATPSDTSSDTEVIPGTGLCPSSRGSQSRGNAGSINALQPGKRPRLTPNPAIVMQQGRPLLAFGTPGGDVQIQAMIQVFINMHGFGMDIQQAVQAPRFASYNYASSFAPHTCHPGLIMIDQGIDGEVADALRARGRKVERWPEGSWKAGGVLGVKREPDGSLSAGADPRRAGFAAGY